MARAKSRLPSCGCTLDGAVGCRCRELLKMMTVTSQAVTYATLASWWCANTRMRSSQRAMAATLGSKRSSTPDSRELAVRALAPCQARHSTVHLTICLEDVGYPMLSNATQWQVVPLSQLGMAADSLCKSGTILVAYSKALECWHRPQ